MADVAKSGRRVRKQVDYSQFAGDDDDFDDDFKDMTPPPSKKQKVAKEPKLKLKKEKEKKEPKSKKDARKPVDEKVYERELELAMALSKSEVDHSPIIHSEPREETTDVENTEPEMPVLEPVKKVSPRKRSPKKKPAEDPDLIEVLEEDVQEDGPGGRKRRRAAAKAVKKFVDSDEENDEGTGDKDEEEEENDDEFKADAAEASDSGPGEDSGEEEDQGPGDNDGDSDFEGHWNKTKKKGRGRGKPRGGKAPTPSAPKVKPRLSATVQPVNKGRGKPLSKTPSARSDHHHSPSPSSNRAASGGSLVIRKPSWIPPGPSGGGARSPLGGVNVKSPGGIRLGLSKKSRVKPLHASVKVP